MRSPLSRVIMSLVAVGVTSATQPISLSNFTPRIENLPPKCQTAYTTTIEGCQEGDFGDNARCSNNCVQGLIKISQLVNQECGDVDVPETSIIGVFLLGKGVEALCQGITVTTIGTSSTQAPPAKGTPAQPPAPDSSQAQSSAQTTQSASSPSDSASQPPPSTSALSTATYSAPSNTQTAQLTLDTGTPPAATQPPTAQQTSNSQKSNQDSGGGSPFDVQAVSSSSQVRLCAMTAMLGIAVLFAAL